MRNKMIMLIILCAFWLCGCAKESTEENGFRLYSINEEEFSLVSQPYQPKAEDTEAFMTELLELSGQEDSLFLPEHVSVNAYSLEGDILTIDFSEEYAALSIEEEILYRAACVRNFTQIPDVRYVQFCVNGEALLDSSGNPVGVMSADSFLEYSGKEINSYKYVDMELYFADSEDSSKLVVEERSVYYNSNSTLEKAIVEQLVKGPQEDGHLSTLSSATKIVSVSVADGIAYVNLDEKFLNDLLPVGEEVPIYSIVNSLIAAGNVTKVQISVNGDNKLTFRENMTLDKLYEENMELVIEK